jgi:hypothetical protein
MRYASIVPSFIFVSTTPLIKPKLDHDGGFDPNQLERPNRKAKSVEFMIRNILFLMPI